MKSKSITTPAPLSRWPMTTTRRPDCLVKFDDCQGTTLHDSSATGIAVLGQVHSCGTCNTANTAWAAMRHQHQWHGANGRFNGALSLWQQAAMRQIFIQPDLTVF